MTWLPLLLADPSPCLRWLVLRDLFQRPAHDPELQELAPQRESDPLVAEILSLQNTDGSWQAGVPGPGGPDIERIRMTAFALARLGYLGFDRTHRSVTRAAEYIFRRQLPDGSWPLGKYAPQAEEGRELPIKEHYSMIPLQTAFPLRGLAACGYACDPRAERAYDWLLAQRLPDSAWPTGVSAGVYGGVGGYRRLAHSRWGCRANTTGALICLALHPEHRMSEPARRAMDHLLGRETREAYAVGCEVARLTGAELSRGFLTYFARFDLGLILDLCARVKISKEDPRVADLLSYLLSLRGQYGLWEYKDRPQISRWLTFDLMRSMACLDHERGWIGQEPRTPFRAYPKRSDRT
jgi:hypothetical protein